MGTGAVLRTAALLGAAAIGALILGGAAAVARAQGATFTTLERGRYLVDAGDCAACHTAEGGKSMAGGAPDSNAVRNDLLDQHHAGQGNRHRQLDR